MIRANEHVVDAEKVFDRLKRDAPTGLVLTPGEAQALVGLIEMLRWELGY